MWGGVGHGRGQWPLSWREPEDRKRTCAKCGARMKVTPTEDTCVYCQFSEVKRIELGPRDTSLLPSVKSNVRESLHAAEQGHKRPRFVSLDLPKELGSERGFLGGLLIILFLLAYMTVRPRGIQLLDPGPMTEFAQNYFLFTILLWPLATAINLYSTIPTLKVIGAFVGLAVAIPALTLLCVPSLLALHAGTTSLLWPQFLLVLHAALALWTVSFFVREHILLVSQA